MDDAAKMESQAVIELRDLHVRYGRTVAVDHVSLRADRGTVYALLGRNGAGKSSIVRSLLGFQKPDAGEARLWGEDVWHRRSRLMDRIGVVPEDPDAPPEMTALQILDFCSALHSKWDQKTTLARLERLKVPLKTPFGRLSKGQKRQVLLATALAHEPELLILDDPTLGLDVVARKELFEELISELADRGTTVFVTTHDLAGIEAIADRVGILLDGRLLVDEEIESLKARFRRIRLPAGSFDSAGLAPLHMVAQRRWGAGVEAVVDNWDERAPDQIRASTGASEIDVSPLSLEEIFIAVYREPLFAPSPMTHVTELDERAEASGL